jgi:hypothetical protein
MATITSAADESHAAAIPPLQAGDRLSAEEFLRRYEAMPEIKKAELIEGVVYMPSPVSVQDHGAPHAKLITWMGVYEVHTPGVESAANSTIRLDLDNVPQPDGLLQILPEYGGNSRTIDGYLVGAPELADEISASTASYDLHDKLNAFRRTACRNMWSGEFGTAPWTGFLWLAGSTSACRLLAAVTKAAYCPVCGWRSRHCCRAIWPTYWRLHSKGWSRPNMPSSWQNSKPREVASTPL